MGIVRRRAGGRADKAQLKITHATIKKVTDDIEALAFNTAISQMMIFVNAFTNARTRSGLGHAHVSRAPESVCAAYHLRTLAATQQSRARITSQTWPTHDEAFLVEDEIEIVLQVNGKVRDRIKVPLEATNEQLEAAARANEKVRNAVGAQTIRKVVVVPKKLVNIVAA